FFQAEDGIRDFHVTGVQACALPISGPGAPGAGAGSTCGSVGGTGCRAQRTGGLYRAAIRGRGPAKRRTGPAQDTAGTAACWMRRSEERRVGKASSGRLASVVKTKRR